jgi:hypothetical protein
MRAGYVATHAYMNGSLRTTAEGPDADTCLTNWKDERFRLENITVQTLLRST